MRLERLDLTRFGHFTDHVLDLGPSAPEGDLHVVYGANEAGKSTTLAALTDLLYGMPLRSPHAHLHDYKTMELGARLHQNGTALELRRYKNALTDAAGERLDGNAIDLHGISREAFGARFSFDGTTLQSGSEAMLANRGDLGEALFSASAGVPDVNRRLEAAMDASDRFWEPRKTKDKLLTALLGELADIEARLKAVDTDAKAWRELKARAQATAAARSTADEAVARSQRTLRERASERAALGWARQRRRAQDALENTGELPDTPPDWLGRLRELVPLHAALEARVARAREAHERLGAEHDATAVDATLLALAPRVAELEGELSAERERAERIADLDDAAVGHERRVAARRQRLGAPETLPDEALLPGSEALQAIERLVREHDRLDDARRTAREERERLLERRAALGDENDAPPDPTPLQSLVAHIRETAGGGALERFEEQRRASDIALDAALAALRPWRGDAGTLERLTVPGTSEREARRRALAEASERVRRLDETRVETERRRSELVRERAALAGDERLDDAHADTLRSRRDAAWHAHADALDEEACERARLRGTARAFAAALAEDDALAGRRLHEGARVSRLRGIDVELEEQARHLAALDAKGESAREALDVARTVVADEATALGLPPETPAADVDAWLVRRERALAALLDGRTAAGGLDAARARRDGLAARLHATLAELATPDAPVPLDDAPLGELLAFADGRLRVLVEAVERTRTRRAEHEQLGTELADRERRLAESEAAWSDWRTRWKATLAGHWLVERDAATVGDVLATLRELGETLASAADDASERTRLDAARTRFLVRVRTLLDEASETGDDDEESLLARLAALAGRVTGMRERQAERARLAEARDVAARELETVETERLPLVAELDGMRARCRVDTLPALDDALERARERRERAREVESAGEQLVEALDADSVEAALERLADVDRDALDDDVARLEGELTELQRVAGEHRLEAGRAQDALDAVAGDAEAARLAERRANVLLELRERAADTLRMRLGRETVLEGVRRYRDAHRGGMLDGAREAFVALTLGRYADLQTRPDGKGNERLRAVTADGRSLETDQLSDGTRFQLYLALRIAAYHAYATHRVPLPFVADDVMESFDEARTGAALGLLAEMGRKGQVIYLTHHRRVVEIAREVTDGRVRVHELPEPPRAGA